MSTPQGRTEQESIDALASAIAEARAELDELRGAVDDLRAALNDRGMGQRRLMSRAIP